SVRYCSGQRKLLLRAHAIAGPTIEPRVKSDRLPGLADCCRPETSAPPSLPIFRPDGPDRAQSLSRKEVSLAAQVAKFSPVAKAAARVCARHRSPQIAG